MGLLILGESVFDFKAWLSESLQFFVNWCRWDVKYEGVSNLGGTRLEAWLSGAPYTANTSSSYLVHVDRCIHWVCYSRHHSIHPAYLHHRTSQHNPPAINTNSKMTANHIYQGLHLHLSILSIAGSFIAAYKGLGKKISCAKTACWTFYQFNQFWSINEISLSHFTTLNNFLNTIIRAYLQARKKTYLLQPQGYSHIKT